MDFNIHHNRLIVLFAGFAAWLVLSASAVSWLGTDAEILGLALLFFSAVISLLYVFRFADWISIITSGAIFAYVQFSLWENSPLALTYSIIFFVCLIGQGILSWNIRHLLSDVVSQLEANQKLIDELTIHDAAGLIKWPYAMQRLVHEIDRGRRWNSNVSVFLLRVVNWEEVLEEHGTEGAEELMIEVSKISASILRAVDYPSRYDEMTIGAVLPETNSEGAVVAVHRVINVVAQKARIALCAGIATFPEDAVAEDKLVVAAKAALQFAVTSDIEIVAFNELKV